MADDEAPRAVTDTTVETPPAMVLLWLTVVFNAASARDTGPAATAAPPIT